MLTDRIIGRVGAEILAKRLANPAQAGDTVALFRLDKLSASQVAAVARSVMAKPDLVARMDLMIPEVLVEGQGLPPEILIQQNAGYVRNNAETNKEAILTASGSEHNLSDTLAHVTPIGAKEMRSEAQPWVDAALHTGGLSPVADDRAVFQAAIGGLLSASEPSLVQIGEFCAEIVEGISTLGLPIRNAVGYALPRAGLPRDSGYFSNAKTFGSSRGPWQKAFLKLLSQRAPLLRKLRQNGQPLDADELVERIEANVDEIAEGARQALEAFAAAPVGDQEAAAVLAHFEWEADGVYLAFDKPKEKQQGLADTTLRFFDHDCDDESALGPEARKLLEDLKSRERRAEFIPEDEEFFATHRRFLERNTKLLSRWEKALFGKPIECNDFFDGFARVVNNLHAGIEDAAGERILRFTVNKGRTEWRERFNHDAGCFFSAMYRGLRDLMGAKVDWKVTRMTAADLPDPLFDFERFIAKEREIAESRNKKFKAVTSVSRQAMQIKFDVELLNVSGGVESKISKTQLLWSYRPTSIGLSMVADMRRLLEKGAVGCTEVSRRLVSKKGGVQNVSLLDTGTLEATYSTDAGSLVPAANKLKSLRADIKARIKSLAEDGRLTDPQRVRSAWDAFEAEYIKAMEDFVNTGLHGEAVMRQAESFGALLNTLMAHARGDVCRSRLVSEVLSVGTAIVAGDNPSLIIPPWHPERMKALAVKSRRVAGFVTHLLSSGSILYGDREIFMRELADEITHPFYPEIAVLNKGGSPKLVSESSTVNGYSLLEAPVRGAEDAMTDVDPAAAAKQARELLERYVGLQPHEASNLSVVLYNADAAELPLATVRELSSIQEGENIQCSVSVRHTDQAKLRSVYGELVNKAGDDPDLPVVSETSDNFISKLRIAVTPISSTPGESAQGFKAYDVAFLHDVVARSAREEWLPVSWTNDRPSLEHAPSRWSYRSVSSEDELKSTTFLTCPWQTASGWAYVSAVGAVCNQTDAVPDKRFLPARRISLQSQELAALIKDAHELAEWVATYDELLDKRQLQHNDITVVRYRRGSTNGRNMIVSSTSELRLLGVLVRRRLDELNLQLDPSEVQAAADKAKRDALSVSGDIVLRAAKRGVAAGEMIGLVLSRHLLAEEFKAQAGGGLVLTAYFLLDDYASWLSQPESRIADILAINVEEREEGIRVVISIVESKYVGADGLAAARRGSREQLLQTLDKFREALFGDPGRLDRDVWLARLADMLIDADIPPGMTGLMERARSKLREGDVEISLRGYSQVYVHSSDAGSGSASGQELLLDEAGVKAWQEIFDRDDLRKLVEAYAKNAGSLQVRAGLGPHEPWSGHSFKKPAPRVPWLTAMGQLANGSAEAPIGASADGAQVSEEASGHAQEPLAPAQNPAEADAAPPASAQGSVPQSAPSANLGVALSELVASKYAGGAQTDAEREEWAQEVTKKLKAALNSYGLQAAILGTRLTPNGCLVRLAGSDRLRVEDIENKRTQLLTTHAINLVTVQPKPGEIVVTVAGSKRQAVSLWELWSRRELNRNVAGINTSFLLGVQEINGAVLYLNLGAEFGGLSSHEPHSLVAGATGSGKSVLIQALLLDIAATNPKDLAQIILIDPKMGVDYAPLADLPHMRDEIVTTKEKAGEVLEALVQEMEGRYRAFANARARDLPTYNAKVSAEERLPMVFLVHDEFADWMLDDAYKGAVGAAVQRLGVKARAAGIHLIFAAQRPDKDVMPMQLRENLGNRLILKVSSEATSKIALDRPGAELLLGRGHLAAKLNGEQGLVFAQAPFLSDQEIEAAVAAIRVDNQ